MASTSKLPMSLATAILLFFTGATTTEQNKGFAHIVNTYENRVIAYFDHRIGDFHQAQDLTQETFVRLWKTRETYRYEGSSETSIKKRFEGWLFGIAWRVFLEHNAKKVPTAVPCLEDMELANDSGASTPHLESEDLTAVLHLMPQRDSSVLRDEVWRADQPKKHRESSRERNRRHKALSRARRRLASVLHERGWHLTAVS